MNDETMNKEKLRVGDWVEVRSKDEILQTLDRDGRLDGMPFMPEMFAFCGQAISGLQERPQDLRYGVSGSLAPAHRHDPFADSLRWERARWLSGWLPYFLERGLAETN